MGKERRGVTEDLSRGFGAAGLAVLAASCLGLADFDLSNGIDLDCIVVGCPDFRELSLKWCLGVTDMGIALVALNLNCKQLWVILAMGLYYYGLRSTSATYSVIFLNLIPIVTSLIAIILRAEKLVLTNWPGRMKLLGILTCAGGTMMVSLYKGNLVHHAWPTHLLKSHSQAATSPTHHSNTVAGTLFLCCSCLGYAFWFIIQVRLAKVFPSRYWGTTLTCFSGSVQAFLIGILIDPKKSAWTLKWDLQLLTVMYSGVFNTGVAFILMSWAVMHRGPVYPSMFNSLAMIATVIMDSVLLGTSIYLGSILGTFLVIIGLYAFLWGKGKELERAAAALRANQKQDTANSEQRGNELQVQLASEIA
ncbi:hypothetical protein ACP4OV_019227 [Aristida adscensionis]